MVVEPTPAAAGVVRQELGTLEVAEQVFRDLALKAIGEMEGVAGVGRPGGIFRRRSPAQALQVERGEGEVAFSIHLSVCYDVRIPELVDELRQRIREEVENATGYRVRAINVTVEHIVPPGTKGGARPRRRPQAEVQESASPSTPVPPELPKAAPGPGQQ